MKLGYKEKEILKMVGIGVLVGGSLIIPTLPMVLAPFLGSHKQSKQNAKKTFKRMKEKDLIFLSGEKVKLTATGKKLLKQIEAEDITIERPDKWDGFWRVIAYDIPDRAKKERDYFRLKLELLGFIKVQESLFAIPFECKEEIAVFAQSLGVSPFVLYMQTDKIPYETKYLRSFDIER